VQFTAGAELRRKLERLQKLMSADLADVIDRAVTELGGQLTLRDVCLMCHAHNQYEANRDFGRAVMARHRSGSGARKRGSG
jgi:hypothetical protein